MFFNSLDLCVKLTEEIGFSFRFNTVYTIFKMKDEIDSSVKK